MNKKKLALGLVALFLATFLVSCKVGENDPGISLVSRSARISGEWTLTSASYTVTDVSKGTEVTTYNFDGTNMTVTENGVGITYPYSDNLTINKDGSYKHIESHSSTWLGTTYTYTDDYDGVWYFISGNKILDVKDKERVEFLVQKRKSTQSWENQETSTTTEYTGASNSYNSIFLLDRLASDEMIILFDESQVEGSDSETKTGTKTYQIIKD